MSVLEFLLALLRINIKGLFFLSSFFCSRCSTSSDLQAATLQRRQRQAVTGFATDKAACCVIGVNSSLRHCRHTRTGIDSSSSISLSACLAPCTPPPRRRQDCADCSGVAASWWKSRDDPLPALVARGHVAHPPFKLEHKMRLTGCVVLALAARDTCPQCNET